MHTILWADALGPVASGISIWPPVWEDCIVARSELLDVWTRALDSVP